MFLRFQKILVHQLRRQKKNLNSLSIIVEFLLHNDSTVLNTFISYSLPWVIRTFRQARIGHIVYERFGEIFPILFLGFWLSGSQHSTTLFWSKRHTNSMFSKAFYPNHKYLKPTSLQCLWYFITLVCCFFSWLWWGIGQKKTKYKILC